MHTLFLVLACVLQSTAWAHLVLEPPAIAPAESPAMGLVFAGGFSLAPERYRPLVEKTQRELGQQGIRLWAVLPKFPLDLPVAEVVFAKAVRDGLEAMLQRMDVPDRAGLPVFYGGHSRGGQLMLEFANRTFASPSSSSSWMDTTSSSSSNMRSLDILQYPPRGLVLCAAGLVRKFRADTGGIFYQSQLPILTISGELDGLFRVFRLAESYYHSVQSHGTRAAKIRPVVLVPGGNHMSFATGDAPPFVAKRDIPADKDLDAAQNEISYAIGTFLLANGRPPKSHVSEHGDIWKSLSLVQERAQEALFQMSVYAGEYFRPILQALELEGSYHLKPPCSDLLNDNSTRPCWMGSEWTERMSVAMANLTKVRFETQDRFWKVWLVNPVHLPSIVHTCPAPTHNCYLTLTTVSQLVYPPADAIDSGFYPVSAEEIRVKFKSRQAVHLAAGVKKANFRKLDDMRACRRLNQLSLDYAYAHAPASILERFQRRNGVPLTVGDDVSAGISAGVTWIFSPLRYQRVKGSHALLGGSAMKAPVGNETASEVIYVEARSPILRTRANYPVKLAAGMHYCKLLSPARALEWLYTDALKAF